MEDSEENIQVDIGVERVNGTGSKYYKLSFHVNVLNFNAPAVCPSLQKFTIIILIC